MLSLLLKGPEERAVNVYSTFHNIAWWTRWLIFLLFSVIMKCLLVVYGSQARLTEMHRLRLIFKFQWQLIHIIQIYSQKSTTLELQVQNKLTTVAAAFKVISVNLVGASTIKMLKEKTRSKVPVFSSFNPLVKWRRTWQELNFYCQRGLDKINKEDGQFSRH